MWSLWGQQEWPGGPWGVRDRAETSSVRSHCPVGSRSSLSWQNRGAGG